MLSQILLTVASKTFWVGIILVYVGTKYGISKSINIITVLLPKYKTSWALS